MNEKTKETTSGYIDRKVEAIKPMNSDEELFLRQVTKFKHMGFGRMIQLIQRQWFIDNLPMFLQHKASKYGCALVSGLITEDEVYHLKQEN